MVNALGHGFYIMDILEFLRILLKYYTSRKLETNDLERCERGREAERERERERERDWERSNQPTKTKVLKCPHRTAARHHPDPQRYLQAEKDNKNNCRMKHTRLENNYLIVMCGQNVQHYICILSCKYLGKLREWNASVNFIIGEESTLFLETRNPCS